MSHPRREPSRSGLAARLLSLWRGLRGRSAIEAEMAAEFRHHLELRTEHLIREGLSPEDASRKAHIEFGHMDSHKEDARAARGLRPFDQLRFSWLDAKLGLRMLAKYPGLSLVSILGMSVAIAIGATAFAGIQGTLDPALPLDEGDRIVSIRNWDVQAGRAESRLLRDYLAWRTELRTVRELGAFRHIGRNLILEDGTSHLVAIAEITASGFRVARVPPVMGRPLTDADERPGAEPVVILTYEEWQRRFASDPDILGRSLRLGSANHTVVGVMPAGFRFPINDHYWIPLQLDASRYEPREGPSLFVFGRLADGATIEQAQREIGNVAERIAAASPATHEHLRPQISPYTHAFFGFHTPGARWALRSVIMIVTMLVVLVAVNVAVLVYARTATRVGEIAVRTALGASRRRIVTQLFVEALVMSLIAALVGLTIAGITLATAINLFLEEPQVELPFWMDFQLSPELSAYVVALAILAAVIVGVLPGLRATGKRVQAGLQRLSSRGSQMQLGRTWTMLIVAQVAVAVVVLPFAGHVAAQSLRRAGAEAGYPAEQVLRASLGLEREVLPSGANRAAHDSAFRAQFKDRAGELLRRFEAEAAVAGVAFSNRTTGDSPYKRLEGENGERLWAYANGVDVDLFTVLGVPISFGREFTEADRRPGADRIIVNRVLAERLFGGGNPIGRRIRRVGEWTATGEADGEPGPWLEIVGVVPDYAVQGDLDAPHARMYEPVALDEITNGTILSVRVRGATAPSFAPRVQEIAVSVDSRLQLHHLRSAAVVERLARRGLTLVAMGTIAVVLSVLLLSAAGVYAMMSFTVARRRREIGIRSALGADARRILTGIFARAGAQLGAGIAVGLLLAAFIGGPLQAESGTPEGSGLFMLPLVAAIMIVVGLLAAWVPAKRGLAIQPTEALREE